MFRWYAQLRDIEDRAHDNTESTLGLIEDLNQLEAYVGKITVPLSYADELYDLRNHIEMVRTKLLRA